MDYLNNVDFEPVLIFIGNILRKQRTALNLSIVDLSVKSGIAESYISQIENAKRINVSMTIYLKLAYYLDLPPSSLLENTEQIAPFGDDYEK